MISTWGIFWVGFFSYLTLRLLYKYFFINRLKKSITPEKEEKIMNWIKEVLVECAKNIEVHCIKPTTTKKK